MRTKKYISNHKNSYTMFIFINIDIKFEFVWIEVGFKVDIFFGLDLASPQIYSI